MALETQAEFRNPPSRTAQKSGFPETDLTHDLLDYLRNYARERPDVAALWCLGIGFILGWKLKPW